MNNPFFITSIIALIPFTIARCYQWALLSEIQRYSNLDKEKDKRLLRSFTWIPVNRDAQKKLMDSCQNKALVHKFLKASKACLATWGIFMISLLIWMIKN